MHIIWKLNINSPLNIIRMDDEVDAEHLEDCLQLLDVTRSSHDPGLATFLRGPPEVEFVCSDFRWRKLLQM